MTEPSEGGGGSSSSSRGEKECGKRPVLHLKLPEPLQNLLQGFLRS